MEGPQRADLILACDIANGRLSDSIFFLPLKEDEEKGRRRRGRIGWNQKTGLGVWQWVSVTGLREDAGEFPGSRNFGRNMFILVHCDVALRITTIVV